MNENYLRLSKCIGFDRLRIGEEIEEFPMMLLEVGENVISAIANRDSLLGNQKRVEAGISAELRNVDKKPTEGAINAELLINPDVIEATQAFENAKYEAGMWGALHEAMRAKGSSMKRYGELISSGFLAPNASYNDQRKEINEVRRDAPKRRQPLREM